MRKKSENPIVATQTLIDALAQVPPSITVGEGQRGHKLLTYSKQERVDLTGTDVVPPGEYVVEKRTFTRCKKYLNGEGVTGGAVDTIVINKKGRCFFAFVVEV